MNYIKDKRHPDGMIDLRIVPFSTVMPESLKRQFKIPENHHVLIVDMGEYAEPSEPEVKK